MNEDDPYNLDGAELICLKKFGYHLWQMQIVVAAIAYEAYNETLISDYTFDLLCRTGEDDLKKVIPSFDKSTGQWCHDILTPELKEFTEKAIASCNKSGYDLLHTTIAEILHNG